MPKCFAVIWLLCVVTMLGTIWYGPRKYSLSWIKFARWVDWVCRMMNNMVIQAAIQIISSVIWKTLNNGALTCCSNCTVVQRLLRGRHEGTPVLGVNESSLLCLRSNAVSMDGVSISIESSCCLKGIKSASSVFCLIPTVPSNAEKTN